MSSSFPLTPAELRLRTDLGVHGDTGNEAHAKLDRLKADTNNILTDTADIQPRLISVESDIASLQSDVTTGFGDVSTILAAIQNATYGLSAIHDDVAVVDGVVDSIATTLGTPTDTDLATDIANVQSAVDENQADLDTIIAAIGTPINADLVADIAAVQSTVNGIQNNTRTTVAMATEMELPNSGDVYYKIILSNYDSAGNMEAPDSAPTVAVETAAGTDRSGNLYQDQGTTQSGTMVNDGTGVYYIFYQVNAGDNANEQLVFEFTVVENAVTRTMTRVSRVVEEISSTFTAADRTNLNAILTDTNELQSEMGDPVGATFSADIQAIKTVVDQNSTDIGTVDTVVDGLAADLVTTRNKDGGLTYNQATDSLEALSEAIASLTASASKPQMIQASASSTAFGSGNSQTVTLGSAQGMTSIACNIKELRVTSGTTTCTDFDVEVFEDSTKNISLFKYEKASAAKGDLRIAIDLLFVNQNPTPDANMYVEITNNTDTSTTQFDVELRALEVLEP